jgi:hypothetical protein
VTYKPRRQSFLGRLPFAPQGEKLCPDESNCSWARLRPFVPQGKKP